LKIGKKTDQAVGATFYAEEAGGFSRKKAQKAQA
jgi:hypothetical protein